MAGKPKIIAVVGPTSSGKSDYAVHIAKWLGRPTQRRLFNIEGAEIISADSRQVYKGLDIGSGKVPRDTRRTKEYIYKGIPHHMLDVVSPKRIFTAADFKVGAEKAMHAILAKRKVPIICGGTGFYIDSLLFGAEMPDVKPDPKLRSKLENLSTDRLFIKLSDLDPERAATIDRMNRRRLVRSLEIVISTGKPIPKLKAYEPYKVLKIGLHPEKEILNRRIHKRLVSRIKEGMIYEVERLHKSGVSWKRLDDMGLEYRYVSRFLRGLISKVEMLNQLESEIVRYAKRQMTWFKRDKQTTWFASTKSGFKTPIITFLIDRP